MQYSSKRIVKNTIFLYLRMVIVLGISLYTTRAILRTLGVEDFGIYNVVAGFVSMFGFLSTMMSNAILRFYNNQIGCKGEKGITSVYNNAVILQLFFFLIIFICLESIGVWYINNKMVIPTNRLTTTNWLFQFAIVSLFFSMIEVPFKASILAHERMDFFSIVSISDALLKLGIVFLLIATTVDSLWLYGLLIAFISFLNVIVNVFFCRYHYKEMTLSFKIDKPLLKEMSSFLGWSTMGNFSFMLKEQGVNMVLNLFFGPVVNAARGVTMQVISALQQFVSNNNIAVAPQMAQSYARGEYNRSVSLFLTVSKLNFILFFIIALPIGLEIDFILNLWLGDSVPNHSSNFIVLVLFCYIINNWNSPLSNLFYATGKMKSYQIASLIILSIVPIAYVAFIAGACPEWAFIITFCMSAIHHMAGLLIIRKYLPFSIIEYFHQIVLPSIFIIIISPIIPLLIINNMDSCILRVIIVSMVSIACVCVPSFYLVLRKAERQMVIAQIMSKIYKKL